MLTTTTASAETNEIVYDLGWMIEWERSSCDTGYHAWVTKKEAGTSKYSNGSCAGYAWIRVLGDSWGEWRSHSSQKVLTSPSGKFRKAQHKGCENCTPVTTEVG
jgi:hypothetical protein